MPTARDNELRYFWARSRDLHEALRGGDVEAACNAYDEIEGIRRHALSPEVAQRCEALLDARVEVREITREPFYADFDHFRPKAEYFGTGFLIDNIVITCAHHGA